MEGAAFFIMAAGGVWISERILFCMNVLCVCACVCVIVNVCVRHQMKTATVVRL